MLKKRRIARYLAKKGVELTPFDYLLAEWKNGTMQEKLSDIGLGYLEVTVDWHPRHAIECIGIQGMIAGKYAYVQVYPTVFEYDFEEDEANAKEVPLISEEQIYELLKSHNQ